MVLGDCADINNLRLTFAIFCFGVPDQGWISNLFIMVRGQPILFFLATLDKNLDFLHELVEQF